MSKVPNSFNNPKVLKQRLDKLVSLYVRNLQSHCISCGKKLLKKQRQAGHYVPREVLATRWDLNNVNVQCARCNVALGGNLVEYRAHLDPRIASMLDDKHQMYKQGKLSAPTLEMMQTKYCQFLRRCIDVGAKFPQEWLDEWKKC